MIGFISSKAAFLLKSNGFAEKVKKNKFEESFTL